MHSLAVQADGKIVVGGQFTSLGGLPRNCIGRLNADGTLDTPFNPGASGGYVFCLELQADGKILAAGNFTTLGGEPRAYIGRLSSDGTLDTAFNPGADYFPSSLAVQADGRIVVGGHFSALGGQPRNHIGRLNPDGTLDPTLNQGTAEGVYQYVCGVAVQTDGKILVVGSFTTLTGQERNRLGRLNSTDPRPRNRWPATLPRLPGCAGASPRRSGAPPLRPQRTGLTG